MTEEQKQLLTQEFNKDASEYMKLNKSESFVIKKEHLYPCLSDKYQQAGDINSYFWQDLWAARLICKDNPELHYDIGSRIDGFIAHLLAFRENVKLIDIRDLESEVDGVDFICADATNLENIEDNSIESLSALCSLEHFGLGRYGDPVDPEAHIKAFKAIQRVMKKGGNIYISVPVGVELLAFNAHRIYNPNTIVNHFSSCELVEFTITSMGKINYNADLNTIFEPNKSGEKFGLFHFKKV